MGNTTILEINHDQYEEIENNKEEFVDSILDHLRYINSPKLIPGGKIVVVFHRSGKLYSSWIKWKKRWCK